MAENKTIAISTIPIAKLTTLMNNFIFNTITHLNKISVKGDEKLAEFDKKLNDLEIMTTLLEAKLNSLPEKITSAYPPLQACQLDDVNPIINPIPEISAPSGSSNPPASAPSGGPIPPPPPMPGTGGVANPPPIPPSAPADAATGAPAEDKKEEEEKLSPEQELDNLFSEKSDFRTLFKMLKIGVPKVNVEQKAKSIGIKGEEFDNFIEKVHNAHPNIV